MRWSGPDSGKRPRQDSNLRTRLRRPLLYPLSYEGGLRKDSRALPAVAEPVPNRLRAPSHARVPLAAVIRDQLTAALASALRGVGVDPPAEIPLEQPAR